MVIIAWGTLVIVHVPITSKICARYIAPRTSAWNFPPAGCQDFQAFGFVTKYFATREKIRKKPTQMHQRRFYSPWSCKKVTKSNMRTFCTSLISYTVTLRAFCAKTALVHWTNKKRWLSLEPYRKNLEVIELSSKHAV